MYLIGKAINGEGCVALKMEHGNEFVEFKKILAKAFGDDVEFVTISRPSAYAEYEPYRFVNTKEEFERAINEERGEISDMDIPEFHEVKESLKIGERPATDEEVERYIELLKNTPTPV